MLLLDLRTAKCDRVWPSDLMLAITGRVRSCDDVGWFERNVIGVLLPGTGAQGADTVAGELEALMAELGVTARWEVLTYPEHWERVGDDLKPRFTHTFTPRGGSGLQRRRCGQLR